MKDKNVGFGLIKIQQHQINKMRLLRRFVINQIMQMKNIVNVIIEKMIHYLQKYMDNIKMIQDVGGNLVNQDLVQIIW